MQTRIVTISVGGYPLIPGGDVTKHVRISGEDVSNEALIAAKERANTDTGVCIDTLFQRQGLDVIFLEQVEPMRAVGIHPVENTSGSPDYYVIGEGDSIYSIKYDSVALVMSYLGYGIPNFEYEILNPECIVGYGGAVIPYFGTGLVY